MDYLDNLHNEKELIAIAKNDADVAISAVRRINDESVLIDIAKTH